MRVILPEAVDQVKVTSGGRSNAGAEADIRGYQIWPGAPEAILSQLRDGGVVRGIDSSCALSRLAEKDFQVVADDLVEDALLRRPGLVGSAVSARRAGHPCGDAARGNGHTSDFGSSR